jgi:CheY-like chemotaxis protein
LNWLIHIDLQWTRLFHLVRGEIGHWRCLTFDMNNTAVPWSSSAVEKDPNKRSDLAGTFPARQLLIIRTTDTDNQVGFASYRASMENPFESQPSIFVVDDELEIARMLTVVLQMNLFNAVAFTDPRAALEAARASAPDYFISDIVMPDMSGIELAIAIRLDAPKCKILLFSGHIDAPELIRQAQAQGHEFALVQKPIHPTKLVEAIQNL